MWRKVLHKTNFHWCHLISHHKMLFYHWKPSVQTRNLHSNGHKPSFALGKPLSMLFKSKYIQELIPKWSSHAYKFHGTSRFKDDLWKINDDSEFSSPYIYSKQLELKLKHQGEHVTFLDLDKTIEDNIFVYKLLNKRDKFPFFIVRMTYLSSNIPSSIFYGSIISEFLLIAPCTLILTDFVPKSSCICIYVCLCLYVCVYMYSYI